MNFNQTKEATMQVSQSDSYISHAVIGQEESISMGMSEDAALMHILSSALYTYPKLAAVREVICNGWDGHIIADLLNTPLEITLAEGQFRVRDFGPGIKHEMIGKIYGTYGNSTKRLDGKQTGGFGLGSKAPFAYIDNFEVISCHEGTKTIYRVSKSSMEKGGKPSINKIVSMPTTETGITVTYSVQEQDTVEFMSLINEVVILGGIPARINGQDPVDPLPLLESPTGYIINSVDGTLLSRINVRYGNVVYPIPKNNGFADEWEHVLRTMNRLWDHSNIIFMAQPDTVSIAPNRESLNFTEGTVKTLKGLLGQFSPQVTQDCEKVVKHVVAELTNRALAKEPLPVKWQLLEQNLRLESKQFAGARHFTGPYAFTVRKARINHLLSQRDEHCSHANVFMKRFERLIREKAFPDTKFAKKMRKALISDDKIHSNTPYRYTCNMGQKLMTGVLHKFITAPLYAHIASVEKLDEDRLFIGDNDRGWGKPELVRMKAYQVVNNRNAINVLHKRALIVRYKTAAKIYLDNRALDGGDGWIIYVTPKNPERIAEVEEMFQKLGYVTTVHLPAQLPKEKASDQPGYVAPEKKVAPKRKGYLTLSQSFTPREETFLLSTARETGGVAGLTDPMAFVMLENKSHYLNGRTFCGYDASVCFSILKLWGEKIAVVTPAQAIALGAKGVPDLITYINEYVDDVLVSRPDFPRYLAFGKHVNELRYTRDNGYKAVMNGMQQHEDLMNELGIRFSISAETAMLLTFFNDNRYTIKLPKSDALAAKVKESPKFQEILKKLNKSPWAKFIDLDKLGTALEHTNSADTAACEIPYTILRNLLK